MMRSLHHRFAPDRLVVALLAAVIAAPAAAQTIDVLSIAATRFTATWTLDGSNMESTRAKLLNTDVFGADGIVTSAINIIDTAAPLDAALLADVEVVFIGYLNDSSPNAFTGDELAALVTWVEGGGGLLATCDSASYDAVCAHFGYPETGGGGILATASGAGWNHPALVGPFGSVRQVQAWGTIGGFDEPTDASVLLRHDSGDDPLALAQLRGGGRVVFLADVDTLSDNSLSPGDEIERANDALLGNLVTWLAGAVDTGECLPDTTTLCIDDAPGDGRFRVRVTYDTVLGGGLSGNALATSLDGLDAPTGGLFTFFDPSVPEMVLKVLNACGENGFYWIFFSAGTNAGFTVTVEDLVAGGSPWTYTNPDLTAAPPVQDIQALACP